MKHVWYENSFLKWGFCDLLIYKHLAHSSTELLLSLIISFMYKYRTIYSKKETKVHPGRPHPQTLSPTLLLFWAAYIYFFKIYIGFEIRIYSRRLFGAPRLKNPGPLEYIGWIASPKQGGYRVLEVQEVLEID